MARVIAQNVRLLREERGMSAADLVAGLQRVGVRWDRSVVARLETGRRGSVSATELFALALTLEVPPAVLVIDLTQPQWSVTEEKSVSTWSAMLWLLGLRTEPAGPRRGPVGPAAWVQAVRELDDLISFAQGAGEQRQRFERAWPQREGDAGVVGQKNLDEQRRHLEQVEQNLLDEVLEDLAALISVGVPLDSRDVITPALAARMAYYAGEDHDPHQRVEQLVEDLRRGE